ncbi:MAG: uracil-DNA glycosylase [Syntrophorhabdales bacterium]
MDETHAECRVCRHYYVTWDRKFPHGCKAARFKSAALPSVEVRAASGKACLLFEKKAKPPGNKAP